MGEVSWWKYYTDCRDGLALDMFGTRFTETQVRGKEKIDTGVVYPLVFVVSQDSTIAQMYNFKVCERNSEEEKKLACDHDTSLQEEETWGIKIDLGIRDLSIAQRLRWRDKNQRIVAYTKKVQALQ